MFLKPAIYASHQAAPTIEWTVSAETVLPETERQTIVHCCIPALTAEAVRIWLSTWLIQEDGSRKKMIHAEGVTLYPDWLPDNIFKDYWFTLVFEALDKGCTRFDLVEEIPEPGGFRAPGIPRNKQDVYRVALY